MLTRPAHLLLIVSGLEGRLVEDTVGDTEHQGGITSDLSIQDFKKEYRARFGEIAA